MANALYLQEGDSGTTVSLITGTLKLRMGAWQMSTPDPVGEWKEQSYGPAYSFRSYGRLIETFDLVAKDSAPNIRTGINVIEDLLERARLWHTRKIVKDPIWLVMQSEYEGSKRALVYGGSLRFSGIGGSSPLLEGSAVNAQLTIMRHPLWENLDAASYGYGTMYMLGGVYNPASSYRGSAPGRIDNLQMLANTGDIRKLWVGIRDYDQGCSSFVALWELELGTYASGAPYYTGLGNESGASPYGSSTNNKLYVSPAGSGNVKRVSIKVEQVLPLSGYTHMIGRYLVLLRAKVQSGDTVVFQLRYGFSGESDASHRIVGTTYYAGTGSAYRLIELGEITIPTARYGRPNVLDYSIRSTDLQLWMERIATTSNVDLDCLILIPSEHLLKIDTTTTSGGINVYTFPDEENLVLRSSGLSTYTVPSYAIRDWYWPMKSGVIVTAGERLASSILNDSMLLNFVLYPRWLGYRVTQ